MIIMKVTPESLRLIQTLSPHILNLARNMDLYYVHAVKTGSVYFVRQDEAQILMDTHQLTPTEATVWTK